MAPFKTIDNSLSNRAYFRIRLFRSVPKMKSKVDFAAAIYPFVTVKICVLYATSLIDKCRIPHTHCQILRRKKL